MEALNRKLLVLMNGRIDKLLFMEMEMEMEMMRLD